MTPLSFLGMLTVAILALNVLAFITARVYDYLTKLDRVAPETPSLPVAIETVSRSAPLVTTVPEEATAGYWWGRLFTPAGILGLLVIPLQLPMLVINSSLLATTLETLLDHSGSLIMVLNLFGWEREIRDFDLFGLLVSLGQMIAASALYLALQERENRRLVLMLALSALFSLLAYETAASIYRGWKIDGGLWNAALSGLFALGVAATEATVGIPLVDRFLIPLLLAILWSVATPLRAITRWWGRRRQSRRTWSHPRQSNRPGPLVLAIVYPLAALEKAIMSPLRRLDHVLWGFLPRGRQRLHQGGDEHAIPHLVHSPESMRVSGNGSVPGRVSGDQHEPSEFSYRVDHRP